MFYAAVASATMLLTFPQFGWSRDFHVCCWARRSPMMMMMMMMTSAALTVTSSPSYLVGPRCYLSENVEELSELEPADPDPPETGWWLAVWDEQFITLGVGLHAINDREFPFAAPRAWNSQPFELPVLPTDDDDARHFCIVRALSTTAMPIWLPVKCSQCLKWKSRGGGTVIFSLAPCQQLRALSC